MTGLIVADKQVVVPGEELSEGIDYLPSYGTYRHGELIRASKFGLVTIDGRAIKIIPLSGKYLPKKGDTIIARVIDVTYSGWICETNSAYRAMLSLKDGSSDFITKGADLTKYFNFGDYLLTKIVNVTSQNLIDLSMKGPGLRKLSEGRILKVNPHKVPRIIGKQGSMVSMVKSATNSRIMVGQNGIVWVQGDPKMELIAVEAIMKIQAESHISGLTERMKTFLESKVGKFQEITAEQGENYVQ